MADLIGQHLGQYEITGLLGEGGMATVYRARQASIKRDVAIKVMQSRLVGMGDFVTRFEREAQTIADLSHPHILKVFDYGQHNEMVYLVMELLTGGSLAGLIKTGPLPPETICRMLDQIASALDYAHRQGIVHRDLKPQNVLLDKTGNTVLTDFGIAKILTETTALTQTGIAMGTPLYMAPEQWRGGPVEARTDIYALGVMLFEMLSGDLPFRGETPFSLMHKHIYEPPPVEKIALLGFLGLDQVLGKALAKEPADRFASATALAAAFSAMLAGKPPVITPRSSADALTINEIGLSSQPWLAALTRLYGNRLLLGMGIIIIALLVIGGIVSLLSRVSTSTPTLAAQVATQTVALAMASMTAPAPTAIPSATMPPAILTSTVTNIHTATASPTTAPNVQTLAAMTLARRGTLTATQFTLTPTPNEGATLNAIVSQSETAAVASFTKTPTVMPSPTNTPTSTSTPTSTLSITPTASVSPTSASVRNTEAIVSATKERNYTALQISRGQTVSIQYLRGSWRAGPSPTWPLVGPDGDPQVSGKTTFPVRNAPVMSLIVGIGDQVLFPVGEGRTFKSTISGILWLSANDDDFSDNRGTLTVLITVSDE